MIRKPEIHRYSDTLIDLIVYKIEMDQGYLKKARIAYSNRRK